MAEIKYPLSLVVRAVDNVTKPLQAINDKLQRITAPVRRLGNRLGALNEAAGLGKMVDGFKGVGSSLQDVGSQAFSLGAKLAGMAAAAGFAFYRITAGAIEAGAKLKETAQITGLNVDELAQLQYAAGQAHVSQEEFNDAMEKFAKNLGDAKAGGGQLLTFLEKVSPAMALQIRGAADTDAALTLMRSAFQKLDDPTKRARLSAAAFGRSSLQLGNFLGQSTAEIERLKGEYYDLAGSQDKFADRAGDAEKASLKVSAAFDGLRNAAAAELFPALSEIFESVAHFLASNREGLTKWAQETAKAVKAWIDGGGMKRLIESIQNTAQRVSDLVDRLGGLKTIAVGVGAVMAGPLALSIVGLGGSLFNLATTVIPVLIRALGLLWPVLASTGAAIAPIAVAIAPFALAAAGLAAAGYQIYKNWADLKLIWKDFWSGSFLNGLETVWNMVKAIGEAVLTIVNPIKALQGVVSVYRDVFGGSKANASLAVPSAGASFQVPKLAPGDGVRATEAKVSVDFSNLPKGTRVTQDRSGSQPVDLSLGYSMVTP